MKTTSNSPFLRSFLAVAVASVTTCHAQNEIFTLSFTNTSVGGVLERDGSIYIVTNENPTTEGPQNFFYDDSYIHKVSLAGSIEMTNQIDSDMFENGRGQNGKISNYGPNSILVSPSSGGLNPTGLKAIDSETLDVLWNNVDVRSSVSTCLPLLTQDRAVITSINSGSMAMTFTTGETKWTAPIPHESCLILSPDQNSIYYTSRGADTRETIGIVSTADGTILDTGGMSVIASSSSGPTLTADGTALYLMHTKGLDRFDANNVSAGGTFLGDDEVDMWGNVNGILSPDETIIYGGGYLGSAYRAVSTSDGSVIWEIEIEVNGDSPPILSSDGRTLYIVSAVMVNAVDTSNGFIKWTYGLPAGFTKQMFLNENDNRLYLAVQTGAIRDGDFNQVKSYVIALTTDTATVSPAPTTSPPTESPTAAPTAEADGARNMFNTGFTLLLVSIVPLFVSLF